VPAKRSTGAPPKPAPPPDPDTLPHPVTFFLTRAERRRVLRALRAIHADRRRALLVAIKLGRRS